MPKLLCIFLALVTLAGCGKSPRPRATSQPGSAASASQVISDVVGLLGDLDSTVNLELRPMRPIVDVRTSTNHDLVQAQLLKAPNQPDGPCVLLHVVTNNTKFTEPPVRDPTNAKFTEGPAPHAGDWVRIYIETEKDGEIKKEHTDLEVAKVVSDSDLLLQQGPPEPLTTPVTVEVWRRTNNKLAELEKRLQLWIATGQPNHDWEPTPDEDVLHEIVERLNQTLAGRTPPKDWRPDSLLATLPDELRNLPAFKSLAEMRFAAEEGRLLQEAVWLRNISYFAAGGDSEEPACSTWTLFNPADPTSAPRGIADQELARAAALFDWTIRHVQLVSRAESRGLWRRPWQSLMFGKGTAEERAWVFILLARQQGLDAVILAAAETDESHKEAGKEAGKDAPPDAAKTETVSSKPGRFLSAVLIRKQLYLFDAALGMPLPGADGKGIATLNDASENDGILRQLDLDENRAYPWKAADLAMLVPCIAASPLELSARAAELERADKATRRLILTVEPTVLAGKLKGLPHLAEPRLWPLPVQTDWQQTRYDSALRQVAVEELLPYISRPMLWKARLLDFKRSPAAELKVASRSSGGEDSPGLEVERSAKELYMKVREEDELATWVPPPVLAAARLDAGYWLGQVALDRGNWAVAKDYFGKHTLDRNPGGPWTQAARYNLGRAYEGAGNAAMERAATEKGSAAKDTASAEIPKAAAAEWEKAIAAYQTRAAGLPSPQELGNRWRAKQLKAKMNESKSSDK